MEENKEDLPGYPESPKSEDVFEQMEVLSLEDPETGLPNEKQRFAGELDVPGSELDDRAEAVGSEDEENNYYSLGGEGNDHLEEGNDDVLT